jgi:hypothetical protein
MTRSARRAAERKANKAANNPALPSDSAAAVGPTSPSPCDLPLAPPLFDFPEPGAPLPSLSQITPARLAANRDNAQKSTGPKTNEGKAISSQNRTKHGLARKNGNFSVLPSEDLGQYYLHLTEFLEEHQPETPTEIALVHALSESLWLRNRAQNYQAMCFNQTTGALASEKQLALYLRYETTYSRAFNSSLNQLLKLRAEKRKAALGFEAQQRQQQAELRAAEKHQMKKDAHYWEVLKKDAEACHQLGQNLVQKMTAGDQNPGFVAQIDAEYSKHNLKRGFSSVATAAYPARVADALVALLRSTSTSERQTTEPRAACLPCQAAGLSYFHRELLK